MKKITSKMRNNGMKYCSICRKNNGELIDAKWFDSSGFYYCDKHKPEKDKREGHYTLADEMSWMRL